MARKIPRDCSVAEWSANAYVEAHGDYSLIKEGFLNTALLVPISRDRKVCFSRHRHYAKWKYPALFGSLRFIEDLADPPAEISDAIFFTAPANHWHFFLDGLSNLSEAVLDRCGAVYVDQSLSDDQVAFLVRYANSIVPADLEVKKLSEATYAVRNVYVPVNRPFTHKVGNLKSCLSEIDAPRASPDSAKRIYVTREGAKTRRLLNESELISMLGAEFGFHYIQNEDYSLLEQLSLYRGAETVMGPHGAGLTNILFSNHPTLLVEMFNTVRQPFYVNLAKALDIQYLGIEGIAASPLNDRHRSDNSSFHVDVDEAREALRSILNA